MLLDFRNAQDFLILLQAIVLLLAGVQSILLARVERGHGWLAAAAACIALAQGEFVELANLMLTGYSSWMMLAQQLILPIALSGLVFHVLRGVQSTHSFVAWWGRHWAFGTLLAAIVSGYALRSLFGGLVAEANQPPSGWVMRSVLILLTLVYSMSLGVKYLRLSREGISDTDLRTLLYWRWGWTAIGLLVFVSGWLGADGLARMRERQLRDEIMAMTQVAAAAVPIDKVNSLKWGPQDLGQPGYEDLKRLMMSFVRSNQDFRFAMLMGIGVGEVKFLVDSEPPTSSDYSPPGQVYEEAAQNYLDAVSRQSPFVMGPIEDRWGKWITVSVPIAGVEAKQGWVTMDFDVRAEDWSRKLRLARLPALVLTFMVFVLLAALALAFERIRASAALASSMERRSRTIIEGSRNCVLMLDAQGLFVVINRNGLAMLGRTAEEVRGAAFVALWPPRSRPMIAELVKRTLAGAPAEAEVEYDRPDKKGLVLHFITSPFTDEHGDCAGLVGIGVDITERRRAEVELRAAKELAEDAARARSEFLALMSHEIRTPLSSVISLLHLLQKQHLGSHERRYAELAKDNAETLLQILDDLLDASKIEAGKLVIEAIPFNVARTMAPILEIMRVRAEAKGLSITFEISPQLPQVVMGDPTRLRQVLSNLLSNAVKFTAKGGIHVHIFHEHVPPEWVMLHMRVADTGVGIDPAAQSRLFKRFEQGDSTTTRRFGGTGLGLSIVKNIAEMMGGSIVAESEAGKGSVFTFTALLSTGPDQSCLSEPSVAVASVASNTALSDVRLRLLYAEDNETNQFVLQSHLMLLGHDVEFAGHGAEALEKLRTTHYDAVFMDERMPVMDGLEATRQLRSTSSGVLDPEIYVVALTANSTEADRDKCYAAGMNDYLTKPVHDGELRRALERIISYQRMRGVELAKPESNERPSDVPGLSVAELLAMAGVDDDELSALKEPGSPSISAVHTLPKATLRTIMQQFIDDAPRRISTMREAMSTGDAETLGLTAHSLKSVARYVQANALAESCAKLEALADAGQLEPARGMLDRVEKEILEELPRLRGEAQAI